MSRSKRPPVGVVWKQGERRTSSGVFLAFDRGAKLWSPKVQCCRSFHTALGVTKVQSCMRTDERLIHGVVWRFGESGHPRRLDMVEKLRGLRLGQFPGQDNNSMVLELYQSFNNLIVWQGQESCCEIKEALLEKKPKRLRFGERGGETTPPGICSMEVITYRNRKMCLCTIVRKPNDLVRSGRYSMHQLQKKKEREKSAYEQIFSTLPGCANSLAGRILGGHS
ncbi:hypothetical protein TNCV_1391511 [Trichonephila clavipes]|nr:hypothetical protein TNCV_1391511 [Trichonephila clavipes]